MNDDIIDNVQEPRPGLYFTPDSRNRLYATGKRMQLIAGACIGLTVILFGVSVSMFIFVLLEYKNQEAFTNNMSEILALAGFLFTIASVFVYPCMKVMKFIKLVKISINRENSQLLSEAFKNLNVFIVWLGAVLSLLTLLLLLFIGIFLFDIVLS